MPTTHTALSSALYLLHTVDGNVALHKFGTCSQQRRERYYSNYEIMPVALLRPVFLIPYVAMNFMAALAIRILIANSCTRWRLIIKRLSQDQGRTDFQNNLSASPFNDGLSRPLWTIPISSENTEFVKYSFFKLQTIIPKQQAQSAHN